MESVGGGGGGGGGGGKNAFPFLEEMESPYQAIVLSSLMEPPIQNGEEQHRLERIPRSPSHPRKLQSPHCSTVWVSLPHTPRSFIRHKPPSFNFTSQSLYRYLWTVFCSSVLLALLSLFLSSRSLSLSLSLQILLTLGRMQCATPWAASGGQSPLINM